MEKGKAKASGSQGNGTRTKSKGDQDKTRNYKRENLPQALNHDDGEGMNNQLTAFQGSSRRREGKSIFGSNMFDDPFFNDPFFTRPFGEPFKSSRLFGEDGVFNEGIFDMGRPGKLLNQFQFNNPPSMFQETNGRSVPIEGGHGVRRNVQIEELSRHHTDDGSGARSSSREPIIEHPDDADNRGSLHDRQKSPHFNSSQRGPSLQPMGNEENSYSFYSSSVMCGGSNGPYYAAQTTRRKGPNGVIEEEHQEKDSTSGRAHHRVSHGLGEKGHSLIRERKRDGQEEKFETLHNLAQEEVPQFENQWERVAEKNLPKWSNSSSSQLGPSVKSQPRPALPSGGSSRKNQH